MPGVFGYPAVFIYTVKRAGQIKYRSEKNGLGQNRKQYRESVDGALLADTD